MSKEIKQNEIKGYQPTKDTLDVSNPPRGGSGFPSRPTSKYEKTDKKD